MTDRPAGRPADASVLDVPAASTTREAGGVELHVVAAGDPADPPVVLLHGFPDFFYGWRRQVGPLVDAGYRVLVPDQRGYNLSDAPDGIRPYRVGALTRDVVALLEAEGRDAAHVVGHDWGAVVAWNVALRRPSAVDRLVAVNGPHPAAYWRVLRRSPRQMLRSLYALWFQLPRLPEWLFRRDGFAGGAGLLRASAPPGTFSDADLARYRAAWAEGSVTAMMNWYRAAARYGIAPDRERVAPPTLVVWGERDPALVPALAAGSVARCEDGRLARFPEAGHWVHLERPRAVTDRLLDHLGE